MERNNLSADLYFLIYKFLSGGPLKKTLKTFHEELEDNKLLPKRLDWLGQQHERTVEDLLNQFPSVSPDYLLQLCWYAGVQDNNNKNERNSKIVTLFNLKNPNSVDHNFKQLSDYVKRRHMAPTRNVNLPCNLVNIIRGREISGPVSRIWMVSPKLYSKLQFQRRTLGHLSAVYCLLFDHTGRYIITGADDLLIKLWSSRTGRLITTFRGASSEITDIAISSDNHLLVAGSIDKLLRVWDLQTGEPLAVLSAHTGMITSVNCCPSPCWDLYYIVTTSTDGSVAFWSYSYGVNRKIEFNNKPIIYQEKMRPGQAQMICSSFSPGGTFLASGSADHHVRVYYMKGDEGPHRILEIEAHTDRVDSIQWAHSGLRFLSGSKDGTAIIWNFESQQWKTIYLHMGNKPTTTAKKPSEDAKKLKVTMVAWDRYDDFVITAVSDYTLKIWEARTGELKKVLTGHVDEVYVLEPHPHDRNVILSAGHDGQLFVWDVIKGEIISRYTNSIEGQGYGAIFDVKWSPDGNSIGASDSHGNLLIFGFGVGSPLFQYLPKELFFHTDYRPLVRDQNNWVLDEQTQVPPHLMPPPFLVDIDGNPYPPMLQRLVPGRENCKTDQLVPSIVIGNEGRQEVIQVVVEDNPARSNSIDEDDPNRHGSFISSRSSTRRIRDQEGIRHSTGDWQGDCNIIWKKNVLVQPLKRNDIKRIREQIELVERAEMLEYQRQMFQRPHMISTSVVNEIPKEKSKDKRARKKRQPRAVYYISNNTSESSSEETHISESTSYSDWVAEDDVNSEPKRTRRKQVNYNFDSDGGKNDNDVSTADPEPSSSTSKPKHNNNINQIPEQYRANEWLSEVKPKKAPYFPQMGDELVYFPQGHQLYLDAVRAKNIYEVNSKTLPWNKLVLRGHEYVKVMGISYEMKPPRVCCLKLSILDEEGRLTGKVFSIKYHDMPDVLDFLVLKQNFDVAMSRNWNIGDKFRCMIDDGWWIGEVVSKTNTNEEFAHSPFLCYEIKWDNGEVEKMSPWDMEPLDENRIAGIPDNCGEALPVLEEELNSILYQPTPDDWPNNDRDSVTYYVLAGLSKVMELAIAEPFLVPVDLSVYPTYAYIVEYPIDLSTIKARFENRFYRRITAAQFDIRHLATNAEKFNERHSTIVKQARILTELCLRIIKQCTTLIDVTGIYHQLVETYDSTDTEVDVEALPSSSRLLRSLPNRYLRHASDWKLQAKSLFEAVWECEDSMPFKGPVNKAKYPDYYRVIKQPMDLITIKEKLQNDQYETPNEFNNDMKLIFKNSRTYNTNKRSRIYVMTVRLAAIFEEHMNKIINNWNSAKRRGRSNKTRPKRGSETTSESSEDSSNVSIKNNNKIEEDEEEESESSEEDNKPLTRLQFNNNNSLDKNINKNNEENSDGESEDSFKPDTRYSTRGAKRQLKKDSEDDEDDSGDSFKPSTHNRAVKRPNRSVSSSSDEGDSDNSDDKPLITQIKTHNARKRKNKRLKSNSTSYEEEEEDIEVEESTSEQDSNESDDGTSNSETGTIFTSVSSRGRVRRLTARARALMKK